MEERTVTISRQVVAEYVKKENGKYSCIPVEKEVETESAKRILKVPSIIIEELEKRKIRNEGERFYLGMIIKTMIWYLAKTMEDTEVCHL